MRVVLQRVSKASVTIDNKKINSIKNGLVLFVAFTKEDNTKDIDYIINKIINLRIFNDLNMKMNKSLLDISGSILLISQFTLYANVQKGRRPSFDNSLNYNSALKLYNLFNKKLKEYNINIKTGIFGKDMKVELINDGPVTIIIDSI